MEQTHLLITVPTVTFQHRKPMAVVCHIGTDNRLRSVGSDLESHSLVAMIKSLDGSGRQKLE